MNISVKLHNELNNKNGELDFKYYKKDYRIEKNVDGLTIAYKNNRVVHSKYNIENECKRALEKINKNKNLLIIYGYGLGYIIKYLVENINDYFNEKTLENLKIIVVVEDAFLFKYSYYNIFYNTFNIENENIFFIHSEDNIDYINKIIDYKIVNGVNLVLLPSLTKEEKDKANKLYGEILNNIEKEFSNIFTNMYFENIWTKNIILGIEYINKSPDIAIFKNAFKGLKALLICPGPTLINYIEKIKTYRENIIIICVDTSYSVLCKHGIIPDFVITVDGGFFNSLDFVYENNKFPYLIMDIACNKIIPKIVESRANIVRFSSTSDLGIIEYLKKFADFSFLTTYNTVATTMIDFADYTGFDIVLLIGFDNSYPYYQRHIRHALSYEYTINKTNKLKTMESYYFDTIKNNLNINFYPPTEFIFESQMEYFNELKNKYSKMFIKRIKSDAINIDSFEEDIIENFCEDNIREKFLNIADKLYKKNNSNSNNIKIKEGYIELKNILEEFRNILLNYNENDYYKIMNIIKEYQKEAPILKNILSATLMISERGESNIKDKLNFLISESLKNVNYFLTRIDIAVKNIIMLTKIQTK